VHCFTTLNTADTLSWGVTPVKTRQREHHKNMKNKQHKYDENMNIRQEKGEIHGRQLTALFALPDHAQHC
jgi:hypothetical protein